MPIVVCAQFVRILQRFALTYAMHSVVIGNAPKIFIDIILTDLVTSAEAEKFGSSTSIPNCVVMTAIGLSRMPHRTDITARISFLFGTKAGANSIS
jgi:hypothetical protein